MTLRLRLALAVALLAASPVTRAQTATATHASALREHPDNSARSIMEVHRRASVRILETRRDWIKVEADGLRSGWLPERDLDIGAGEAFVALQTPPAPPAAIELPRVQPRSQPRASHHALLLPVGGSADNAADANAIARLMGVPDANIQQPPPEGLATPDGLREALARFDARVGPGDRAFIYLAGPGGPCAEGVLTASRQTFGVNELARHAGLLARKAGRLVVVTDIAAGGAGACRGEARPRFPAGHNMLVIRAGGRHEDGASGIATRALRACLDGSAPLESRSGLPGGEDWRRCAQQQLDLRTGGRLQLSLAGNPALAPAPAQAPVGGAVQPADLLEALHAQRSEARRVSATLASSIVPEGGARRLIVTGPEGGHLYVLGTHNGAFTLLHPGAASSVERFGGQATVPLPPGRLRVLALVTDAPRNFLRAGFGGNGTYAIAPADGRTLRDLPLEVIDGDNSPACTRSETRNMGPEQARRCSTAFGSALVNLPAGP